jgi:hypothetical protein
VVPVPADEALEVRGRRVIIGSPAKGWRADLRADELVEQDGRRYVPVLPEHDWYRSESEQVETFAPLIAVERVWVEWVGGPGQEPGYGGPQIRVPVRVHEVPGLLGRRLAWLRADGSEARDLRAVSDPYAAPDGTGLVRIAEEADWYRWGWSGKPPRTVEVAIDELWAE